MFDIAIGVLENSLESPLVRSSALLLSTFVAKATSPSIVSPAITRLLVDYGQRLIIVTFRRIESEILTSSVEYLADVLFVFARDYPVETRTCLADWLKQSPMVATMLSEVENKRKFRLFAGRYNLASRRQRT
jgi:hypothetical protein